MKHILFVCTGNACRSQMAEGLGRALSSGRFAVKLAGTKPKGVSPQAVEAMREIGIDISEQTSDLLTNELIQWADYIVTLCNSARDLCPVIPGNKQHWHWDLENPDHDYPDDRSRRQEFARIRDEIKQRIIDLFRTIDN